MRDRAERLLPHQRLPGRQQFAAGGNRFDAQLAQLHQRFDPAGDDGQMALGRQKRHQPVRTGRRVQEQHVVIVHQRGGLLRHHGFGVALLHLPQDERDFHGRNACFFQNRTAVRAADQLLRFQPRQVAPDGRFAGEQPLRQRRHRHLLLRQQDGQNFLFAGTAHSITPFRAKQSKTRAFCHFPRFRLHFCAFWYIINHAKRFVKKNTKKYENEGFECVCQASGWKRTAARRVNARKIPWPPSGAPPPRATT